MKLPLNEAFKRTRSQISDFKFSRGETKQNASIRRGIGTFEIVPEEQGTVVDTQRLNQQIIADVEAGKGNYQYNAKDFIKPLKLQKRIKR